MGKKVKKKNRGPLKEKQVATHSTQKVPQQSNPIAKVVEDGVSAVEGRKPCSHLDTCVDLDKVLAKIKSSDPVRCEDCHEGAADKRGSKGRAKHGKKKAGSSGESKSDYKAIWICLQCGHYACGGIGLPTNPQNHAIRHVRQTRHSLVIQFEKPQLRWCFFCNTLIPVVKIEEENGERRVFLSEVVKAIKGHSVEGSSVEVGDIWFGGETVLTEGKSENTVLDDSDGSDNYVVRGLINLGNTCFFNSILQNLLAIDRLRDYFFNLEASIGPLTVALKKLIIEVRTEVRTKGVVNPRSVFGCIASKAPQFKGYEQHDSHELLRCFLDGLSSEELGANKIKSSKGEAISANPCPTFMDELFGGQISSTVCCMECGHSSTVYEPFLDLSLPVPTKKPLKKKPISRAKKTKLPPKRDVRTLPKVDKVAGVKPAQSGSFQLASNELALQTQSSSVCSTSVGTDRAFASADFSAVEESNTELVHEDTAEQAPDGLSWLDYLGPEPLADAQDLTSQTNDISIIQDSENKENFMTDASLQSSSQWSTQAFSHAMGPDLKPDYSPVDGWEDEVPLQVQGSVVLLLPYNEESTSYDEVRGEDQASSSNLGCNQDNFDGFGDLFNEPEITVGPIARPSSSNDVTESGFIGRNSSESDPDEVDNTSSPVSVESCLVYFTNPELLSGENGYNCEMCLKKLQQRRLKAKDKEPKAASRLETHGVQAGRQGEPLCSGSKSSSVEVEIQSNGYAKGGSVCNPSKGLVAHMERSDFTDQNCGKTVNGLTDMNSVISCCEEATVGIISHKSFDDQNSQTLAGHDKSEESEDEEMDSRTVKVKRDARKRFLIHKAPPVLTIHIKRFSPDARGRYTKLNGHVSFREVIDLKPYMDPRCIDREKYGYRLLGVVEHSGSMRGGHYVAYVRGNKRSSGKADKENCGSVWYHVSDGYVSEVSLDTVLRCEAYILFYEVTSE